MAQSSLVSLAILKTNPDRGNLEYLDYLRPFVLEALRALPPGATSEDQVRETLRKTFGLQIPSRAVSLTLKRLTRSHILRKAHGKYTVIAELPDTGFGPSKARAERHIDSVVAELIAFSRNTLAPFESRDAALNALLGFLNEFSIDCLRVYLQGTVLPPVKTDNKSLVLVSRFVRELAGANPERFESFMVLVQGHMLANALLCPDLARLPKTFSNLTVYLDTPIVIRLLGLEGGARQMSNTETLELIRKLGASTSVFSHTRDEIENVIRGAAEHIDRADGRGAIVMEARREGKSKSDLLLEAEKLDDHLAKHQIQVRKTPKYIEEFQIDEIEFEDALNDEVGYFNARAREFDINSVRSIYVLRRGTAPRSLERARAVLMTSNSAFARAAWKYGARFDSSRAVSPVVTDFSVANVAWLKAPMGAPELPAREILAFCYAALQPTERLLSAFLEEAEKLEASGEITPRDHMLLRVSVHTRDILMEHTLGEEDELSSEKVTIIAKELTAEIQAEEREKREGVERRHAETLEELGTLSSREDTMRKRWFWRAHCVGQACAVVSDVLAVAAICASYFVGHLFPPGSSRFMQFLPLLVLVVLVAAALAILTFALDIRLRDLHAGVRERVKFFLYRLAMRAIYGREGAGLPPPG